MWSCYVENSFYAWMMDDDSCGVVMLRARFLGLCVRSRHVRSSPREESHQGNSSSGEEGTSVLNFLSHHRERRATKAALHRERRILSHPVCSHHRERRATKATLHRERRYTPPRNPLSSPREESHQGSSSSGEERTSALNCIPPSTPPVADVP